MTLTEIVHYVLVLADVALSLAILVAILAAFITGELVPKRSLEAITAETVRQVLRQLELID